MPDNFEEIIKRLQQCRQQIQSSGGASGRFTALEHTTAKAIKSLRHINNPHASQALSKANKSRESSKSARHDNVRKYIQQSAQLISSIQRGTSDNIHDKDDHPNSELAYHKPGDTRVAQQNPGSTGRISSPEDNKVVKAIKGERREFFCISGNETPSIINFEQTYSYKLGARTTAYYEHIACLHIKNKLIKKYGFQTSELNKKHYSSTIKKAQEKGILDDNEAQTLRKVVEHYLHLTRKLNDISEKLGEYATDRLIEQRGELSILEDRGKIGAGMLDRASLGDNPPRVTFYEAKGGNSRLGYRTIDDVIYQQGTTTYLNELTRLDNRYIDALTKYVANAPIDDSISRAICDNTIEVRYELVEAKPNGRTFVTTFQLDKDALNLPKIDI